MRLDVMPMLLAAALSAATASAQELLVRAARIVVAPDMVLEPGQLLIQKGRIAYVGDEIPLDVRSRARLCDYGSATIVPGFVMAQSTLGQERDLAEAAIAFTPDLRASEAFDPWQEELAALPRHGVTAVALSPSPRNVAGGLQALVKPGREQGQLAATELQLVLSFAGVARNPEREPTSLMGQKDMLRSAFAAARNDITNAPDLSILREVLRGSRRCFVHADSFAELTAALDLAREFELAPVLVGARDAHKLLGRIAAQQAAIVLGTLSPDAPLTALQLPAQLATAGIPFCFSGQPEQLRLSAALAVRHGLPRGVALQALTLQPAQLLGSPSPAQPGNDQTTAAKVGSLRQDQSADFLVFGGDPLDLSAPHLATWSQGELIHGQRPGAGQPANSASQTASTAGDRR